MNNMKMSFVLGTVFTAFAMSAFAADDWVIESQDDWTDATAEQSNLEVKDGLAVPTDKVATFTSKVRRFDQKRHAKSIVLDQSPVWQNWNPVANLGPANLADAPVFLAIGPDNYWVFGRYGGKRNKAFKPEPADLEGFDIKLQTTPWPNQFDAPGGLEKGLGGYHAWQSRDMVNWVHHGPVTERFSRWVTSAEYKDGKVYIYYDYPNDQDPHVYVDEDLTDGQPGKNMGIAVKDPSHGSDAGFIRDKQGRFHVIFEDWSPINASKRSWDSPLAGHAVSDDGIKDWKFLDPAVDNRTKDTGKIAEYRHPHWKQHPDWDTNIGKYHVHEPEQGSDDQIIVRHEDGGNVMSVSLLRLAGGDIALFYLDKRSLTDCRPTMRISRDEAATFGPPVSCITDQVGYYVMNNDRAVQLESGRIVLPVALHNRPEQRKPDWAGKVMCYLSDDAGKTWRRSKTTLIGHDKSGKRITVQEPGVVELSDGRLMMFCRTNAGSQCVSWSRDGGDSWSPLEPSKLASPLSPATIERIPGSEDLLCVWNDHSGVHPFAAGKRTPLCIAVSRDNGRTWGRSSVLEDDPDGWYCYTSMTFVDGRVLLAYCAGDPQVGRLNRLKVVALSQEFLDQCASAPPPQPPDAPLLKTCLDYGRSFVNTKAAFNSPRFWVESRCRIVDEKSGQTVEYLQCGLCKAERTFAHRDLFQEDNYDFLPVFSANEGIIFRRHVRVGERYREVRPIEKWWGGTEPRLRRVRGRVLASADEIFDAMQSGAPIVGQTEIRDETTRRTAVIEYPVKTINFQRSARDWQVDTGPVVLPDLSAPPERWSHELQLAYIAFRTPYWADFLVDRPTPVEPGDEDGAETWHYSGRVTKSCRSVLLALEAPGDTTAQEAKP